MVHNKKALPMMLEGLAEIDLDRHSLLNREVYFALALHTVTGQGKDAGFVYGLGRWV
jgi:hypothetical protein